MARRVRFVTCAALPRGDDETRFLAETLRDRGWAVDVAVWSDGGVAWDEAPLTVLRSTWDYPERLPEFLTWAQAAGRVTDLHNPADLVRRNVDKRYLVALGDDGVPVVPSRWVPEATEAALEAVARDEDWWELVIKPAVGIDGVGVERVTLGAVAAADESRRRGADGPDGGAAGEAGWLVQPFLPSVHEEGERSVVFVDGRATHAVTKHPGAAAGEFRVQERWGGATRPAGADAEADALCARALTTFLDGAPPPLYARVDLLRWREGWRVAEIEVVEPSLYLLGDPARIDPLEAALRRRARP